MHLRHARHAADEHQFVDILLGELARPSGNAFTGVNGALEKIDR